MWKRWLLNACLIACGLIVSFADGTAAHAQANFDRPGGDYLRSQVPSGDPDECALSCERDRRCRAWSFNYPTDLSGGGAICWLKNTVPTRNADDCCVSGIRGAGVIELPPAPDKPDEVSIDRPGGDYRSFDLKREEGDDACRNACNGDNKCRAWTFARAGYAGKEPHCFLKKDIKPPRRRAGFTSGVIR